MFASALVCSVVASAQSVKVRGSDTLLPLGQRWAQTYEKKHPGSQIIVAGGGSGSGIAALLKGETDIAESSMPLSESEKEEFKKLGKNPVDVVVALDGVEILVNAGNPVQTLTMDQVKGIFSGTITNWKDVGGKDGKINLYGRDRNSGTHTFLQEHALRGNPYAAWITEFPANAAMVAAVARDLNGICYAGLSSGKSLKHLSIKADQSAAAVEPTLQNINSASYPLSRQLHWFLAVRPNGPIKELCLWVVSQEAQGIAEGLGFISISAETRISVQGRL